VAEITITDPEWADIDALLADIRPVDWFELTAVIGELDPRTEIARVLLKSDWAGVVKIDGKVALIGGVIPLSDLGGTGCPWLLGTRVVDRHPGALMRLARGYIPMVRERYPMLKNAVSTRNKAAIRWLQRIGFTMQPPAPYGHRGDPFHLFTMGD
jgi:hypothetical protein